MPERVLRGHLAGAGLHGELARSGDALVLTGSDRTNAPMQCLLDRSGPQGARLDEPLAQAACGLMAVHGRARGDQREVTRLGVDYVTTATGLVLAHGVLAGLLARARGGAVSGVTVSVAGTALLTVSQYLAAATAGEPDLVGAAPQGQPPPFRSADGVLFELETLDAEPWRQLWTALGVPEALAGRAWRPFMLRYATAMASLPAELHAATTARSFADLRRAAAAAGVAVQPLRSHPQRLGDLRDQDPFAAPWVVQPHGLPTPGPGRAGPGELPLTGMLVVEAGRRVQGPLAGHVLRLLGADVIRIEPAGGDPLRGMPPMVGDCSARFLALNRGKRLVEADLRSTAGRATVLDAVRDADAFVHNWAPGKAADLGLDHDDLAAVNPGLVSAYASGWGDALGADPPPGTDFMVQAYAGLGEDLTPPGAPPAGSLMTLLDVLGGLVAASGVLAGLLGRVLDGRGRRVGSSLLSAAGLLQAPLLHAGGGAESTGRPERDLRGVPISASDGYLVLSRTADLCAVTQALGVDNAVDVPRAVAAAPVRESVERITASGVDAVRACPEVGELPEDPWTATLLQRDGCSFVRPPWTFTA